MFGIPFRRLLFVVGLVEFLVAANTILATSFVAQAAGVALLSVNIALYRAGLWWMDYQRPCTCLGDLTEALKIDDRVADRIMLGTLTYLIVGCLATCVIVLRPSRHKRVSD
jgi:hypothetical protein